jgi:hypothetical protein
MSIAVLLAACGAVPLTAQDLVGARGFVAQLYIKRTHNRHFSFASPRILTADLYDLVQRGGGSLDYDPLCQCKSNDGLSAQIMSVSGTDNQAVARLLLRFDADRVDPPQRVTLMLRRAALAGWKIADIQSARIPSLKAWLERRQPKSGRAAGIARTH